MFSEEIGAEAFRASNGEFGWTRAQIPGVVAALRAQQLAILGGELWWVRDGAQTWTGAIPQQDGHDAVYAWETKRQPDEPWAAFVSRCASDAIEAAEKWPT